MSTTEPTGDEVLATIKKSAEAIRKPGETSEQAFTRFLEQNPGTVAELQRQSILAKRRLTAPATAALCPDPAGETLTRLAKALVDDGKSPTQEQAFARLWESRDPTIRQLVKASKGRQAALTGQKDVTDDADETESSVRTDDDDDPTPGGGVRASSIDFDSGGDLDNRGTQGATGGNKSRGSRAKMFSDIIRPTATARNQGSYNPKRRPRSATRKVPPRVVVSDYGKPEPQDVSKVTIHKVIPGSGYPELAAVGTEEDLVVKRARKLIVKGFNSYEAMYICAAPSKQERRALRQQIEAQRARAVAAQKSKAA